MRAMLVVAMLAVMGLVGPATWSPSTAAAETISYVGDVGAARNTVTPWVTLPTNVQPGDRLVLALSVASDTTSVGNPTGVSGWTLEATRVARSMKTHVWSRVATPGNAGARVNIQLGTTAKSTVQVAAYRGVDPGPLTVVSKAETNTSASRTTPPATAADGAWVLSFWGSKSAAVSAWTAPAGVTARRTVANTGSGRIASLLADSAGSVGAGTYGNRTATSNATSTAATTWTVVLPAVQSAENEPPVAGFTENCTGLACSFNTDSSSDAEGPIASYDWDFGDGESGSGATPTHEYDAAGSYDVVLTVTDGDGATGTVTRNVTVTAPTPVEVTPVTADDETTPVNDSGDAADDPAIWVHPTEPGQSLVIGNDKQGALEVYDLDGTRIQRITTSTSFWGNVDVRQGVDIGGDLRDVVVGYNAGLRTYTVDPTPASWSPSATASGTIPTNGGEGLCAYHSAETGDLSVFVITRAGRVRQYQIHDADGDGLLQGTLEREFVVGSEAEGCVADDQSGELYVSEEDTGLWRYGAEPGDGSTRVLVDAIKPQGHLAYDVEGVTLAQTGPESGYLIVSAQNGAQASQSYFAVYDRQSNDFLFSFRISGGDQADGCERTDGITAYFGDLGPSYPEGLFVCQDNGNTTPAPGNQNFKMTRLDRILPGT